MWLQGKTFIEQFHCTHLQSMLSYHIHMHACTYAHTHARMHAHTHTPLAQSYWGEVKLESTMFISDTGKSLRFTSARLTRIIGARKFLCIKIHIGNTHLLDKYGRKLMQGLERFQSTYEECHLRLPWKFPIHSRTSWITTRLFYVYPIFHTTSVLWNPEWANLILELSLLLMWYHIVNSVFILLYCL